MAKEIKKIGKAEDDISLVNLSYQNNNLTVNLTKANGESIEGSCEINNSEVVANPTEQGTEDLTKLQVNNVVYNIPQGSGSGDTAEINEDTLEFKASSSGNDIVLNSTEEPTEELTNIKQGNKVYSIPQGGGGGSLNNGYTVNVITNNKDIYLKDKNNNFIKLNKTTGVYNNIVEIFYSYSSGIDSVSITPISNSITLIDAYNYNNTTRYEHDYLTGNISISISAGGTGSAGSN